MDTFSLVHDSLSNRVILNEIKKTLKAKNKATIVHDIQNDYYLLEKEKLSRNSSFHPQDDIELSDIIKSLQKIQSNSLILQITYHNLLLQNKITIKSSIPYHLQAELALLWRTLGLINYNSGDYELALSFFEEFLSVLNNLPPLCLSNIWDRENNIDGKDSTASKANNNSIVGIPKSDNSDNIIPILSTPELSYLYDNDDDDMYTTDFSYEHDPLGIVQKIFDSAENFAVSLPPRDRGMLYNVCLVLAIKTGRVSLLLRCIALLLNDNNESNGMSISALTDIITNLNAHKTSHSSNTTSAPNIAPPVNNNNNQLEINNGLLLIQNEIKSRQSKGGTVMTFGKADHGKLGHGDSQIHRMIPTILDSLQEIDITRMASMSTYSVAVDSSGASYVWGTGGSAGSMQGLRTDIEPQLLEALPSPAFVKEVSCGLGHALFLLDSGKIYSWGNGGNGRLGVGDAIDRAEATPVVGLDSEFICSVQCGASHSLAVSSDGKSYSWGKNTQGQCGRGNLDDVLRPSLISSLQHDCVIQVAAGWEHSLALSSSGTVYSWGCGYKDSRRGVVPPVLGLGHNEGRALPERISTLEGGSIISITCGWDHCMALDVKGRMLTWGSGQNGKLGLGHEENASIPTIVAALEGVTIVKMSAGCEHSAAISDKGVLFTWGHGDGGRLGHGDTTAYSVPTAVAPLQTMQARPIEVHCGDKFTMILVKPEPVAATLATTITDNIRHQQPNDPNVSTRIPNGSFSNIWLDMEIDEKLLRVCHNVGDPTSNAAAAAIIPSAKTTSTTVSSIQHPPVYRTGDETPRYSDVDQQQQLYSRSDGLSMTHADSSSTQALAKPSPSEVALSLLSLLSRKSTQIESQLEGKFSQRLKTGEYNKAVEYAVEVDATTFTILLTILENFTDYAYDLSTSAGEGKDQPIDTSVDVSTSVSTTATFPDQKGNLEELKDESLEESADNSLDLTGDENHDAKMNYSSVSDKFPPSDGRYTINLSEEAIIPPTLQTWGVLLYSIDLLRVNITALILSDVHGSDHRKNKGNHSNTRSAKGARNNDDASLDDNEGGNRSTGRTGMETNDSARCGGGTSMRVQVGSLSARQGDASTLGATEVSTVMSTLESRGGGMRDGNSFGDDSADDGGDEEEEDDDDDDDDDDDSHNDDEEEEEEEEDRDEDEDEEEDEQYENFAESSSHNRLVGGNDNGNDNDMDQHREDGNGDAAEEDDEDEGDEEGRMSWREGASRVSLMMDEMSEVTYRDLDLDQHVYKETEEQVEDQEEELGTVFTSKSGGNSNSRQSDNVATRGNELDASGGMIGRHSPALSHESYDSRGMGIGRERFMSSGDHRRQDDASSLGMETEDGDDSVELQRAILHSMEYQTGVGETDCSLLTLSKLFRINTPDEIALLFSSIRDTLFRLAKLCYDLASGELSVKHNGHDNDYSSIMNKEREMNLSLLRPPTTTTTIPSLEANSTSSSRIPFVVWMKVQQLISSGFSALYPTLADQRQILTDVICGPSQLIFILPGISDGLCMDRLQNKKHGIRSPLFELNSFLEEDEDFPRRVNGSGVISVASLQQLLLFIRSNYLSDHVILTQGGRMGRVCEGDTTPSYEPTGDEEDKSSHTSEDDVRSVVAGGLIRLVRGQLMVILNKIVSEQSVKEPKMRSHRHNPSFTTGKDIQELFHIFVSCIEIDIDGISRQIQQQQQQQQHPLSSPQYEFQSVFSEIITTFFSLLCAQEPSIQIVALFAPVAMRITQLLSSQLSPKSTDTINKSNQQGVDTYQEWLNGLLRWLLLFLARSIQSITCPPDALRPLELKKIYCHCFKLFDIDQIIQHEVFSQRQAPLSATTTAMNSGGSSGNILMTSSTEMFEWLKISGWKDLASQSSVSVHVNDTETVEDNLEMNKDDVNVAGLIDLNTGIISTFFATLDNTLIDQLSNVKLFKDYSIWKAVGFSTNQPDIIQLLEIFINGIQSQKRKSTSHVYNNERDSETASYLLRSVLFIILLKSNKIDYSLLSSYNTKSSISSSTTNIFSTLKIELLSVENKSLFGELLAAWLTSFILTLVIYEIHSQQVSLSNNNSSSSNKWNPRDGISVAYGSCLQLLQQPLNPTHFLIPPALLASCVKISTTIMEQGSNPHFIALKDALGENVSKLLRQQQSYFYDYLSTSHTAADDLLIPIHTTMSSPITVTRDNQTTVRSHARKVIPLLANFRSKSYHSTVDMEKESASKDTVTSVFSDFLLCILSDLPMSQFLRWMTWEAVCERNRSLGVATISDLIDLLQLSWSAQNYFCCSLLATPVDRWSQANDSLMSCMTNSSSSTSQYILHKLDDVILSKTQQIVAGLELQRLKDLESLDSNGGDSDNSSRSIPLKQDYKEQDASALSNLMCNLSTATSLIKSPDVINRNLLKAPKAILTAFVILLTNPLLSSTCSAQSSLLLLSLEQSAASINSVLFKNRFKKSAHKSYEDLMSNISSNYELISILKSLLGLFAEQLTQLQSTQLRSVHSCLETGKTFLYPSVKPLFLTSPAVLPNVFTPNGDFTLGFWIFVPSKLDNDILRVHIMSRVPEVGDVNFAKLVEGTSPSCPCHPSIILEIDSLGDARLSVFLTLTEGNDLGVKNKLNANKMECKSNILHRDCWRHCVLVFQKSDIVIDVTPPSAISDTVISDNLFSEGSESNKSDDDDNNNEEDDDDDDFDMDSDFDYEGDSKFRINTAKKESKLTRKISVTLSLFVDNVQEACDVKDIGRFPLHQNMVIGPLPLLSQASAPGVSQSNKSELKIADVYWASTPTSIPLRSLASPTYGDPSSCLLNQLHFTLRSAKSILVLCSSAMTTVASSLTSIKMKSLDKNGKEYLDSVVIAVLSELIDICHFSFVLICSGVEDIQENAIKVLSVVFDILNSVKSIYPTVGQSNVKPNDNISSDLKLAYRSVLLSIGRTVTSSLHLLSALIGSCKEIDFLCQYDPSESHTENRLSGSLHNYLIAKAERVWLQRIWCSREGAWKSVNAPAWGVGHIISENMVLTGLSSLVSVGLRHKLLFGNSLSEGSKDAALDCLAVFKHQNNSKKPTAYSIAWEKTQNLTALVCGGGWPPCVLTGRKVDVIPRALFLAGDPKGLEQSVFPCSSTVLQVGHLGNTGIGRPGIWLKNCSGAFTLGRENENSPEFLLPKVLNALVPTTEMVTARDASYAVPLSELLTTLDDLPVCSAETLVLILRRVVLNCGNAKVQSEEDELKRSVTPPMVRGLSYMESKEGDVRLPEDSLKLMETMAQIRCLMVQLTQLQSVGFNSQSPLLNESKENLHLFSEILSRDIPNIAAIAAVDPVAGVTCAFANGVFRGAQLDVLKNLLKEGDVCFLEKISIRVWKQLKRSKNTNGGKDGPSSAGRMDSSTTAQMTSLLGEVQIIDNRVRAMSHFPTVRLAGVALQKMTGRWFYECTLLSDGLMQIGWADSLFRCDPVCGQGVGDHVHSWAYDGLRTKKWCVSCDTYGRRWKVGDIVGALVDTDLQEMRFYLNGEDLGPAFSSYSSNDLFPALSLNVRQSVRVNFGQSLFMFPPSEVDGIPYRPICDALAKPSAVQSSPKLPSGAEAALLAATASGAEGTGTTSRHTSAITTERSTVGRDDTEGGVEAAAAPRNIGTGGMTSRRDAANGGNVDPGAPAEGAGSRRSSMRAMEQMQNGTGEQSASALEIMAMEGRSNMNANWRQSEEDQDASRRNARRNPAGGGGGFDMMSQQQHQQQQEILELRRQAMIENLIGMGFPVDWALRAAEHCEASVSESSAIAWIIERMELEQAKLEEYEGDSRANDDDDFDDNDEAALDQLHRVSLGSDSKDDEGGDRPLLFLGVRSEARVRGGGGANGGNTSSNNNRNSSGHHTTATSNLPEGGGAQATNNGHNDNSGSGTVQDGILGHGAWNGDVSFPSVLAGRYVARRRHDVDKQEVLIQVSDLDPCDLCPIVASCQLALCVFYARSVMMRAFSLVIPQLPPENSLRQMSNIKQNISGNFFTEPALPEGSVTDATKELAFKRVVLKSIITRCSPIVIGELLKANFRQFMCSNSSPDRLFPSMLHGSSLTDVRDKLPPFDPFTPSCNSKLTGVLANLEHSLFSSSVGSYAAEDASIQAITPISMFLEFLLAFSGDHKKMNGSNSSSTSNGMGSTQATSIISSGTRQLEGFVMRGLGVNIRDDGEFPSGNSDILAQCCNRILSQILEEAYSFLEKASATTYDRRDWISGGLEKDSDFDSSNGFQEKIELLSSSGSGTIRLTDLLSLSANKPNVLWTYFLVRLLLCGSRDDCRSEKNSESFPVFIYNQNNINSQRSSSNNSNETHAIKAYDPLGDMASSNALSRLLKVSNSPNMSLKYTIFDIGGLILSKINSYLWKNHEEPDKDQKELAAEYYSSIFKERKLLQIFATRLKTEGSHRRLHSPYTRSICSFLLQWHLLRRALKMFTYSHVHDDLVQDWVSGNDACRVKVMTGGTHQINVEEEFSAQHSLQVVQISPNSITVSWSLHDLLRRLNRKLRTSFSVTEGVHRLLGSLSYHDPTEEDLNMSSTSSSSSLSQLRASLYFTAASNMGLESPISALSGIGPSGTFRIESLDSDTMYKISVIIEGLGDDDDDEDEDEDVVTRHKVTTNDSNDNKDKADEEEDEKEEVGNRRVNKKKPNRYPAPNKGPPGEPKILRSKEMSLYASTEGEAVFLLDAANSASNLMLSNNNLTVRNTYNKRWSTCRATVRLTSGLHRWDVHIDRCISKNIFIGVVTADARLDNYVGCDRFGWAFLANKAVWHNKGKLKSYGELFRTNETVTITLDLDIGTLSFSLNGKDLGVAVEGLSGPLYPAFSLYNEDDQISLVPPRTITEHLGWSASAAERVLDRVENLQAVLGVLNYAAANNNQQTYHSGRIESSDNTEKSGLQFQATLGKQNIGKSSSKTLKRDSKNNNDNKSSNNNLKEPGIKEGISSIRAIGNMTTELTDELRLRWNLWCQGIGIRSVACGGDFISIVVSSDACSKYAEGRFSPGDLVHWEQTVAVVVGAAKHRLWLQLNVSGALVGCTRQTLQQLIGKGSLRLLRKAHAYDPLRISRERNWFQCVEDSNSSSQLTELMDNMSFSGSAHDNEETKSTSKLAYGTSTDFTSALSWQDKCQWSKANDELLIKWLEITAAVLRLHPLNLAMHMIVSPKVLIDRIKITAANCLENISETKIQEENSSIVKCFDQMQEYFLRFAPLTQFTELELRLRSLLLLHLNDTLLSLLPLLSPGHGQTAHNHPAEMIQNMKKYIFTQIKYEFSFKLASPSTAQLTRQLITDSASSLPSSLSATPLLAQPAAPSLPLLPVVLRSEEEYLLFYGPIQKDEVDDSGMSLAAGASTSSVLELLIEDEVTMASKLRRLAGKNGVTYRYESDSRWKLLVGIQCSLLGQLMLGLERTAAKGASKSSGNNIGNNTGSVWEHCLRNGCTRGILWADITEPRYRIAPIIIRSGCSSSSHCDSKDRIGQLNIRHKENIPKDISQFDLDETDGIQLMSTSTSFLFSLLHMKKLTVVGEGDIISDWSLFCIYITEATEQLQKLFDKVFHSLNNDKTSILSNLPSDQYHEFEDDDEDDDAEEEQVGVLYLILNTMHFAGVLLGLALRCGATAPVNLPNAVWAVIVCSKSTRRFNSSLRTGTVFADAGSPSFTHDSSSHYTTKYTCEELTSYELAAAMAIQHGISTVYPEAALRLLSTSDLIQQLCHVPCYHVHVLRREATYEDGLSLHDDHIQYFWAALLEIPREKIVKFLCWLWKSISMVDIYFQTQCSLMPAPFHIISCPVLLLNSMMSPSYSEDDLSIIISHENQSIVLPKYSSLSLTFRRVKTFIDSFVNSI